jgi:hypothetical protein
MVRTVGLIAVTQLAITATAAVHPPDPRVPVPSGVGAVPRVDSNPDYGFPHLWCAAPPGAQQELIASDPDRFFWPPYVGHRGWLGVRLDRDPNWTEIAELCQDAYRVIAPARLVARLDE